MFASDFKNDNFHFVPIVLLSLFFLAKAVPDVLSSKTSKSLVAWRNLRFIVEQAFGFWRLLHQLILPNVLNCLLNASFIYLF